MKQMKFMYKHYLSEPLWFKILTLTTLLISIIFSSFNNGYYQSCAKLAAAIFFCTYGFKFRNNTKVCVLFFALMILCIYLSWNSLRLMTLRENKYICSELTEYTPCPGTFHRYLYLFI